MKNFQRSDISSILNDIAQALDISDTLFEEATEKYKAVGAWLGEGNSPLAAYSPDIYPQGSFNLGTVVKPKDDSDDYDLDIVFQLVIAKDQISPYDLKKIIGDRLKSNEMYKRMLDPEGRRCWTLQYAEGAHFHMDILPAIPDLGFPIVLKSQGFPIGWSETSLAITDKTWPNYYVVNPDWPRSNPRGFANWFRGRMLVKFNELRKQYAEAMKADIEKVPDYKIKTPLQRCIQLLKRNRDLSFLQEQEDRPISVIITTLAANAYSNEADVLSALLGIIQRMPNFILRKDGKAWIQNPVDPLENFADRWEENLQCERKLRLWLIDLKTALDEVADGTDLDTQSRQLEALFGERIAKTTIEKYRATKREEGSTKCPFVPISNPNKPWG
jgi:hypothetical protein